LSDLPPNLKGLQLTVPTGGGKTLASLRFALHHAQAHTNDREKIERVFYIVPYITIIDQNADEVRDIFEKEGERDRVILEHHSNLTPEKESYRQSLLAENWDAPVIFTTQVQFLESLFGAGTRNARRMHQLANSILIFDEVQTIPIRMTHLFTTALRFLVHDCGSTALLCTATQPPFEATGNPYRDLNIQSGQHIIKEEQELYKRLKRVDVYDERKPGGWTIPEIADLAEHALHKKGSVLIVMNTRASAISLYREVKARNLTNTITIRPICVPRIGWIF
jgi:CRISPR-associated endonuclease/helicase Cas3